MSLLRGMHVKIQRGLKPGLRFLHGNVVEVLVIQLHLLQKIVHLPEVQIQKALGSAEAEVLHRVVVSDGGDGHVRIECVDLLEDGLVVFKILLFGLHACQDDGGQQRGKADDRLQSVDAVLQSLSQTQTVHGTEKFVLGIIHTGIHFTASQQLCRSQHGEPYIVEAQLQAQQIGVADPVPEHLPLLFDALCRVFRIFHKIIHHVIGDLVSVEIIFQEHAHLHGAHGGQRVGIIFLDTQRVRDHDRIGSVHMTPFLAADIVCQSVPGRDGVPEAGIDLISEIRKVSRDGSGSRCRGRQRCDKGDGQYHRKNLL